MTKIRSTDSSRMDDARGRGGGSGGGFPGLGGGGLPIPGGMKTGGGLVGLLVILAVVFLPQLLNGGGQNAVTAPIDSATDRGASGACDTELEQIVCGVTNDVQDYWSAALPVAFGTKYQDTKTRLFDQPMSTGCGAASPETGPFYCPADRLVYIDLGFMQQIEQQLVGATSDLAEQYILAHEYGHHVQNLLGTNAEVQRASRTDPKRANQYSVALELQADCYAGAWVGDANRRGLLDDPDEIQEAIRAAEGVGDDRIQQKTSGRIDPERWTHGSAEQRRTWFLKGFTTRDPRQCDTFAEIR
ncbi:MAG: neutral zinc metallopeptidase [Ilumatobacteraceae bacterium]